MYRLIRSGVPYFPKAHPLLFDLSQYLSFTRQNVSDNVGLVQSGKNGVPLTTDLAVAESINILVAGADTVRSSYRHVCIAV